MPVLNIQDYDLPLSYDGVGGFTGGQVSLLPPNLLPQDASAQLVNMDTIPRDGDVMTRRGTRKVYTGSNIGAANKITCINQHDFGTATNLGRQTIAAMSDGTRMQIYRRKESDDTWTVTTGTWTNSNPASTRVHVAELGYKLFMVAGVGSGGAQELFWIPKDSVTYTKSGTNGNADGPNDARQLVLLSSNRLAALGPDTEKNTIYFSQFGDGTVWDRTLWAIAVGKKYDPITGIVPWTNHDLLVLKEQGTWVVNCNPDLAVNNFPIKTVHPNVGSVYPHTACQVGPDIWYLTRGGVMIAERTGATDTQVEITQLISEDIQDIMDRINWPKAQEIACAYFWNNRYFLCVPLDTDTENTVIVCNAKTRKWMGSWGRAWFPRFMHRYDGGYGNGPAGADVQPARLRFGNSGGQVFEWLDWVHEVDETIVHFTDFAPPDLSSNGISIPSSVISRGLVFGDKKSEKDLYDTTISFNKSLAVCKVSVNIDGRGALLVGSISSGDPDVFLPITLPFTLSTRRLVPRTVGLSNMPPCNMAQIVLESQAAKLCVSSIDVSAIIASAHTDKVDLP